MAILEPFDGKQTKFIGLWYHPDLHYYKSPVINLSQLKKFKGAVILKVVKNKYYNNGENGRPNYVFSFVDAQSEREKEIAVEDIDDDSADFERMYTREEVQRCINGAVRDAQCGYTDLIPEDYV